MPTAKYTVKTATEYINNLINKLEAEVKHLDREECNAEHEKLMVFSREIDFFNNINKESFKKYAAFEASLDQALLAGYYTFSQIDLYKHGLKKGLRICASYTKQGEPIHPKGAISPAGFTKSDGVYILRTEF